MKISPTIKKLTIDIIQSQAEIGVATAGLEQTKSVAEQIGENTQRIIDLCDQFLI